jgi:predicted small lipoprotein YifL
MTHEKIAGQSSAVRERDDRHMSTKQWHLACAGIALALLGGCGQKGPLYLPDKKARVVKPVTASPEASRPPEKMDPEQKDDSQKPPTP